MSDEAIELILKNNHGIVRDEADSNKWMCKPCREFNKGKYDKGIWKNFPKHRLRDDHQLATEEYLKKYPEEKIETANKGTASKKTDVSSDISDSELKSILKKES